MAIVGGTARLRCRLTFERIYRYLNGRMRKTMVDDETVASLQLQLSSLQTRLKELEVENAKLASRISNCCCNNEIEGTGGNNVSNGSASREQPNHGGGKRKKSKEIGSGNMHNHSKRYVALKVMYFGKRFYGFSAEAQMEPSIESELFKAFGKARLLVGDIKESQYTRCGRTDKGVSSVGQVIALQLRSKIKKTGLNNTPFSDGEIDYVRVLNRVLPEDIRIVGWCTAPEEFHARFRCSGREYKYFFWKTNLNISAMEAAGKKLLGEHDFRNFCKMDAVNVHTYMRRVTSFEISEAKRIEDQELWFIRIRGSAFLWHQVRCIVAVLFMIGQGLETVDVIDNLLDIKKVPRKPQYLMASEIPLVLHSCTFEDLQFSISPDAQKALRIHLENKWKDCIMESAIFQEALQNPSLVESGERSSCDTTKKKAAHIPLMKRETEPSYDERRMKLNSGASKLELVKLRLQEQKADQELKNVEQCIG